MTTKIASFHPIKADDFFDNPAIRQTMQPGKILPLIANSSSGEPVVLFLIHESDHFISHLTQPRFGLKYGQYIVGQVRVLKLMLLVLAAESDTQHCLAEMVLNWHDPKNQEVIEALASAKPVFVLFYGDDWKCKKSLVFTAQPSLATFVTAFMEKAQPNQTWTADDFALACLQLTRRFGQEEQWLVEMPAQMQRFATTGILPDEPLSAVLPQIQGPRESADKCRDRHHEFIQDQYLQLAAFAWDGFQEKGRGTLLIMNHSGGSKLIYLCADEIYLAVGNSPLPKINKYDPETEIVVTINDHGRHSSSYVVAIPALPPPLAYQRVLES